MAIKPERHYYDLCQPRADVHVSVCVVIKSPHEEVVQLSLNWLFLMSIRGIFNGRFRLHF